MTADSGIVTEIPVVPKIGHDGPEWAVTLVRNTPNPFNTGYYSGNELQQAGFAIWAVTCE